MFFIKQRKEMQGAYCPWLMKLLGLLILTGEENLRVAVRADVHTRTLEYLLAPGAAPRLQVQAQMWD